MRRAEALDIIAGYKGDGISIATMRAIRSWYASGGSHERHYNAPVMGSAAAVGLGLAIAQPLRRVIVLDGDGSLVMQLSGLASVAEISPANFYHFVLVNRQYESSFNTPIPASNTVDFSVIARGAGYKTAYSIHSAVTLRQLLPSILKEQGPVLVSLEVEPETTGHTPRRNQLRRALYLGRHIGWPTAVRRMVAHRGRWQSLDEAGDMRRELIESKRG